MFLSIFSLGAMWCQAQVHTLLFIISCLKTGPPEGGLGSSPHFPPSMPTALYNELDLRAYKLHIDS